VHPWWFGPRHTFERHVERRFSKSVFFLLRVVSRGRLKLSSPLCAPVLAFQVRILSFGLCSFPLSAHFSEKDAIETFAVAIQAVGWQGQFTRLSLPFQFWRSPALWYGAIFALTPWPSLCGPIRGGARPLSLHRFRLRCSSASPGWRWGVQSGPLQPILFSSRRLTGELAL